MIKLTPPHRWATAGDAKQLAELINIAGEGLPVYRWERMADAGQSAWDVGRQRAQREEGSFSFRNAVVRDEGNTVVAGLMGYPLADQPQSWDRDTMPPMVVPLQELEDLAPGTWYVNVLASYAHCRGRGYGSALLGIAEELAAATGRSGMSIIVSDGNPSALRLYERAGYSHVANRTMVKEDWENPGERWLLLIKSLA